MNRSAMGLIGCTAGLALLLWGGAPADAATHVAATYAVASEAAAGPAQDDTDTTTANIIW